MPQDARGFKRFAVSSFAKASEDRSSFLGTVVPASAGLTLIESRPAEAGTTKQVRDSSFLFGRKRELHPQRQLNAESGHTWPRFN
jgi:hypothetical protein